MFWPFLFVVVTILSLAIIGGLAIACFTKVVGVVFLGEPRSEAAASANPAGAAIQTAMLILAVLCAVIGLAPQLILPAVARAAATLLPNQVMPRELMLPATAIHLSLGAAGFSVLVLLIIALRKILNQGPAAHSATWGCGFSQPNTRMQYTGSSFAASFLDFYKPFVLVREKFAGLHDIFPKTSHYHSEALDISEIGLQRGIVHPVMRYTVKLRWLQHGHIQLYIGYIFFAVVGLLFWLVM